MRYELKRPYPRVRTGSALSYGGNQNWFPDANFRSCGCGVIACADTLLYLGGRQTLSLEEYLAYAGSLRRYFPLIPRHGIDGVRLAIGMNLCLRRAGLALRAGWSASAPRFWGRLAGMLSHDLPVVVSIGPNLSLFRDRAKLPLYRRTADGAYREAERTTAHFLTVTALDERWMEVSSWGRQLHIERDAYEQYMRKNSGPLLSNLLYLERTGQETGNASPG